MIFSIVLLKKIQHIFCQFQVLYNPNLNEVSHPARVAYAKFMQSKVKKEIRFDEGTIQVKEEKEKDPLKKLTNSIKKLPLDVNNVKQSIGILKSVSMDQGDGEIPKESPAKLTVETTVEVEEPSCSTPIPDIPTEEEPKEPTKDFRSRTPIEEDPAEDIQSPEPDNPDLLSPKKVPAVRRPSTPIPPSTSPPQSETSSDDKAEFQSQKSADKSDEEPEEQETQTNKSLSPMPVEAPVATFTSDKGKSKTTGKTIGGWL